MGRIIAIDYGRKRVGIAVTDPMKIIANALTTVQSHEVFSFLENYFKNEDVELAIIGKPLQMSGEASESSVYIEEFKRGFQKRFPNLPLKEFDERFTSVLAQKTILESGVNKKKRQDKSLVDKIAAVIILQGYMESNRI